MPEAYTNAWTLNVGYPALKINSGKGLVVGGYITFPGVSASHQLTEPETAVRHVASLYLVVADPTLNSSSYNDSIGVASPLTIAAIDKKIDDGVARTGKFQGYRTWNSAVGNCLTGVSGNYLLTETRDSCLAEFIIAK